MTAKVTIGKETNVEERNRDETNEESNVEEPNKKTNVDETNEERNIDNTNEEPNLEKIKEKQLIERHREFLEERMDPESGLLDELLGKGTLSRKEISDVKDKSPLYNKNSRLLHYIVEKNQCSGLIAALRDTEQIHIVNYLNENGEYNSDYGEEWPLTEKETSILDTNQKTFVDLLKLSDLLYLLSSSKVINMRQLDFISSEPSPCRKTEALLDILQRRSLRDYKETINCLRQSHQFRIADVFESGGVVAKVHSHLDGPLENMTPVEDDISTNIANIMLSDTSIAESARIWELVQCKLIAAKVGGSVVLYIWCETVQELLRLHDLLTSGCLKDHVEQCFNQLLTLSQKVEVKNITMNDEEFRRWKEYFTDESVATTAIQVMPYTGSVKMTRKKSSLVKKVDHRRNS